MLALHYFGMAYAIIAIFVIATATDWLDGYLARKWHVESEFGAKADPYGDKSVCWSLTLILLIEFGANSLMFCLAAIVFAMYDIGLVTLRYVLRQVTIPTNAFAKRKTAALMIALALLFGGSTLQGEPAPLIQSVGESIQFGGYGVLLLAAYFAVRSAAHYLRAYGFSFVPEIRGIL